MGLTMKEKKAITREVTRRYQKAQKKEKGEILNEFIQITGYSRWYGSYRLKNWGRKIVLRTNCGRRIILVGDRRKKVKRQKSKVYDGKSLVVISSCLFLLTQRLFHGKNGA